MKRHPFSLPMALLILLILAAMLVSACSRGPSVPTPTPPPSATPTPRSTPLPEVPTAIPLALEDNPLTILMLPHAEADRGDAQDAADELETLIRDVNGLVVEVQLVNSYGEIVAQLCGATPVVGWVDGFSYIVAQAQGCADPALRIQRDRASGYRADLLVSAELEAANVSALNEEIYCRVNSQDAASWLVPGLMMRQGGVNPLYHLGGVIDVEDYDAVVQGIYDDTCRAGGVPHGYLDDVGSDVAELEGLEERVLVLAESPEIPYDILVYPQTVPLNVRIPLDDAFVQIAANRQNARTLAAILDQSRVERVDRADFDEFRAFMDSTGLNFAALGE